MGFFFKKIISAFLQPLTLLWFLFLLGWIWSFSKTGVRYFRKVLFLAIFFFSVLSLNPVADLILSQLESRYPPLLSFTPSELQNVKWIVVLGGGHEPDARLPFTSQAAPSTLSRLVEGLRLHRALPQTKLLLSGGAVYTSVPEAQTMAGLALSLGVEETNIVQETRTRDTAEQAIEIRQLVNQDEFVLVTSASHMLRAVRLFEKQGLHPIPAPTQHLVKKDETSIFNWFPSAQALRKVEIAWHEYLGILSGLIF